MKIWLLSLSLHLALLALLALLWGRPRAEERLAASTLQVEMVQSSMSRAGVVKEPIARKWKGSDLIASRDAAPEPGSAVVASTPVASTPVAGASESEGTFVEFRPPPARYPRAAEEAGIEGKVLLELQTDSAGYVSAVALVEGSGDKSLDEEAIRTVQNWRLRPLRRVRAPIEFQLKN